MLDGMLQWLVDGERIVGEASQHGINLSVTGACRVRGTDIQLSTWTEGFRARMVLSQDARYRLVGTRLKEDCQEQGLL